ncbi:type IA DNA topoisomerase [uncultured Anaerococcus sp.]|uniref:type IA DNA topoisomerase n=1 Tax=uncultured Anaerococcus sp. TaxID=293428 RepID=UPI0025CF8A89|nr:type IA DNA topoisomerase [uncultured Anaerococcus sp.]
MKLVIAEKPSVARSIANVLNCRENKNGYIEGDTAIVTWTIGHLVTLADPKSYDPRYNKWNAEELPILPDPFKTQVIRETSKQFKIVKDLINSPKVDTLVCATDSGREGELIFRLIYDKVGSNKPFLRLWISSMEDKAIMEGFRNLKGGNSYDNLSDSAKARQEADWLVGINLTRLVTTKNNRKFTIGRVQTPTLNLINERNQEIINFKPEKYNIIQASVSFDDNMINFETKRLDSDKAFHDLGILEDNLNILEVETNEKSERAPKLFDLTSLQRQANKGLGLSAKKTLKIAQELYESKFISYPRTDSRYITDDMEGTIKKLLGTYASNPSFDNIDKIVNNKKVTDHTALLPTDYSLDRKDEINKMSNDHIAIYSLIFRQLLKSVSKDYLYNQTKVKAESAGIEFYVTGKQTIDLGFKELEDTKLNKDVVLDGLFEGQSLPIENTRILDKQTRPPSQYTEDTLLKAMKNAGRGKYDSSLDIERKGLGTTATRADIIEGLLRNGYLKRAKKKLLITKYGEDLLKVAPEKLKEVELTVDWENQLANIAAGKEIKSDFMSKIEAYISETVSSYEGDESVMIKEESIGSCPYCGGQVYINEKAVNCENSKYGKNKGDCRLGIFRKIASHKLTEKEAKDLLENGKTELIKDFISNEGKNFPAYIELNEEGKYITSLTFE